MYIQESKIIGYFEVLNICCSFLHEELLHTERFFTHSKMTKELSKVNVKVIRNKKNQIIKYFDFHSEVIQQYHSRSITGVKECLLNLGSVLAVYECFYTKSGGIRMCISKAREVLNNLMFIFNNYNRG
ncbi:hypothetical protein AB832_07625 [Flavobacteriaceae bacterium (ex Bugula neritina AB1)]|nr:hypothetical protein AB832_07625 [Flavobacteriaceae bacterium (ex Bugula neritina AB1)]